MNSAIEILLVEDNSADVRLTQEALLDAKVANSLHVVQDGVECMQFLRQQGEYSKAPRPQLILLDLRACPANGAEGDIGEIC